MLEVFPVYSSYSRCSFHIRMWQKLQSPPLHWHQKFLMSRAWVITGNNSTTYNTQEDIVCMYAHVLHLFQIFNTAMWPMVPCWNCRIREVGAVCIHMMSNMVLVQANRCVSKINYSHNFSFNISKRKISSMLTIIHWYMAACVSNVCIFCVDIFSLSLL